MGHLSHSFVKGFDPYVEAENLQLIAICLVITADKYTKTTLYLWAEYEGSKMFLQRAGAGVSSLPGYHCPNSTPAQELRPNEDQCVLQEIFCLISR